MCVYVCMHVCAYVYVDTYTHENRTFTFVKIEYYNFKILVDV